MNGTQGTRGTLYGIGVGPGSPDLITLRAVETLAKVDVILAAASPKNEHSLALSIAEPHLPPHAEIVRLDFPMTRDEAVLHEAWERNARTVAEVLEGGRDAAFLTLGDPLVYSTFGYLMRTLTANSPDLPVTIIPGITSFQEAAAKTRTVLCEAGETLMIVPGINGQDRLQAAFSSADSVVVLKTYRNTPAIREAVALAGRAGDIRFASRLGLEGELTARGLENVPEKPHYLSLLISPPKR